MSVKTVTISALADDANGIAATATATAAGTIALTGALCSGGTCTLNNGQIISVDSSGDDSGITFDVVGFDPNDRDMTTSIVGGVSTVASSTKYFKSITSITNSGAIAANADIGVLAANGAASPIIPLNFRARNFGVGVFGKLSDGASLTWKVQATPDDIASQTEGETWYDHSDLTAKTANATGNYEFPSTGMRGVLTAWTSGTFHLTKVED